MFAYAIVQVLATGCRSLEVPRTLIGERGPSGWPEVPRAAKEPRDILRKDVEDFARCVSTSDALWVGGKDGKVALPVGRQLALLHLLDLGRQLGIGFTIRGEEFRPLLPSVAAALADSGCEVLVHAIRNEELRVLRPPVGALDEADFIIAEWFAMSGRRVLFVRRTVSDVAVEHNECGSALRLPENLQRMLDAADIVRVADSQYVPSIGEEAGSDILCKRDARVSFDRDVVVVPNPAEIVESQMGGERRRFRADPLHQAAVAAHRVDLVIENVKARTIVVVGKPLLRQRHADAGGNALPERPGSGFDAGDPVVFRMSRSLAVELTETADVVERHRRVSESLVLGVDGLHLREVQNRPQQHRGVPVRKHEPIAVRPDRVLRIKIHYAVPDGVNQRCSAIGVPGWPDFACCTASIESVRMVLIDNWA